MDNRQINRQSNRQRTQYQPHYRTDSARYSALAKRRRQREVRRAVIVTALIFVVAGAGIFGVTRLLAANSSSQETSGVNPIFQMQATEQTASDPGDIVMGVNGDEDTYVLLGEDYVEGGAHAANSTTVLTPQIETSGNVDTSTAGDYVVTYAVSDDDGHRASIERNVHVVESMETMQSGVPILMYHYIYEEANPPEDLNNNYLEVNAFEEQLQYLTENNFYYPSFAEINAFINGTHSLPAKSVALTFDDGEDGFLSLGVPLAEKYSVPVTSFIIGVGDSQVGKITGYRNRYCMFESHSTELHQAGGTIGHGGLISALTKDEIVDDLNTSAAMLGCHNAFAYPFGDVTDDGKAAVAEAGFLAGVTTANDWAYIGDDVRALNRVRISSSYTIDSYVVLVNE